MNAAGLNGHYETSDELAAPQAIDLPKNTAAVVINAQDVASARTQSFTHFEPENHAFSGLTFTQPQALSEGSSTADT